MVGIRGFPGTGVPSFSHGVPLRVANLSQVHHRVKTGGFVNSALGTGGIGCHSCFGYTHSQRMVRRKPPQNRDALAGLASTLWEIDHVRKDSLPDCISWRCIDLIGGWPGATRSGPPGRASRNADT